MPTQILIVDDSHDTIAILQAVLTKSGFVVHSAEDGRKALDMLRQRKIQPDLAILDIQMPGMSGYEVCEELQANPDWSIIPVVFLTASEERENRLRAFQLGAVGFLNKPVISDQLLEQVAKAIKVRKQWLESFTPAEPEPEAPADPDKPRAPRTRPLAMDEVLQRQAASTGPLTNPTGPLPLSIGPAHRGSGALSAPSKLPVHVPDAQVNARGGITQTGRIQGSFTGLVMFLIEELGKDPLPGISPETLYDQALHWAATTGDIARRVARYTGLPMLEGILPEQVKLGVLPVPFCRKYHVVPFQAQNQQLAFAIPHPYMMEVNDVLRRYPAATRYIADPSLLMTLFEGGEIRKPQHQAASSTTPMISAIKPEMTDLMEELQTRYANVLDDLDGPEAEDLSELESAAPSDAPMVRLVNQLIEEAYHARASDIHIEPWEEAVVVRFRIDGALKDMHVLKPAGLCQPMVSRLKIMANLNIAEKRLPQDGRIVFKQFGRKNIDVDLRVAIAPMNFGEKVVMRLLDKQKSTLPLEALGMSARNLEVYRVLLHSPYGMILHVGPTGSGKSMTLYSALHELNRPDINIQTAEDPIEYTLPRINQLQVQPEIGLTFAKALRAYLRQDPDVILVGEIRDRETAHIAVEAALTGHLLLSTLHTNDSTSTLLRFLEMGIEPFMISPSVVMICAQRLMRRLCTACREPYQATNSEKRQLGLYNESKLLLYRAVGCEQCGGEGYYGRIGVHELLAPSERIRAALSEAGMTAEKLKRIAVFEGMTTLYWDAMDKVRQGISSVAEALARVRPDEFETRPDWWQRG
ncbi:MAG: ATPase, T2SS/T4P/T4SS family [Candidatus Sericytochromatia bacterium]